MNRNSKYKYSEIKWRTANYLNTERQKPAREKITKRKEAKKKEFKSNKQRNKNLDDESCASLNKAAKHSKWIVFAQSLALFTLSIYVAVNVYEYWVAQQ